MIGLAIFGYTALLGYSNFYRMEVQTAVITAPIETVASQADGRVQWTAVKPGDAVKAGDLVISVIDNQLEREIEVAEHRGAAKSAPSWRTSQQRFADEQARMRSFSTVLIKNIEQAKLDMESSAAQLRAAEQTYGRLAHLHMKGFTTDAKLEEAEKLVATLKKSLEAKRVEFESQKKLRGQNQRPLALYRPEHGRRDGAARGRSDARRQRSGARRNRSTARSLNHKNRLAVRAPFDGTCWNCRMSIAARPQAATSSPSSSSGACARSPPTSIRTR